MSDKCNVSSCEYLFNGNCEYERITCRQRPCHAGYKCDFHNAAIPVQVKSTKGYKKAIQYEQREKLYKSGYTDSEIAEIQGVTTNCITLWRRRFGLERNLSEETKRVLH